MMLFLPIRFGISQVLSVSFPFVASVRPFGKKKFFSPRQKQIWDWINVIRKPTNQTDNKNNNNKKPTGGFTRGVDEGLRGCLVHCVPEITLPRLSRKNQVCFHRGEVGLVLNGSENRSCLPLPPLCSFINSLLALSDFFSHPVLC